MNASVATEICTNAVVSAKIFEQAHVSFHDAGVSSKNISQQKIQRIFTQFRFSIRQARRRICGLIWIPLKSEPTLTSLQTEVETPYNTISYAWYK